MNTNVNELVYAKCSAGQIATIDPLIFVVEFYVCIDWPFRPIAEQIKPVDASKTRDRAHACKGGLAP